MAKKAKTAAKTATKSAKAPTAKVAKKTAAKKATKKTTAKKAAAKKATKKATATKLEVYQLAESAPGERYFILANGKPIKHVAELAEVMDDLEDHVFDHHVTPDRNDFHTWVKDVFKDIELAKKILGVTHRKELQLVIYKHAAHKAFQR